MRLKRTPSQKSDGIPPGGGLGVEIPWVVVGIEMPCVVVGGNVVVGRAVVLERVST